MFSLFRQNWTPLLIFKPYLNDGCCSPHCEMGRGFKRRGKWPQLYPEGSRCPSTAGTYLGLFPRARRPACSNSLSGSSLPFTHPNEQLREINASNCQTIKSYVRGRIPQPPALRVGYPYGNDCNFLRLNQTSSLCPPG